MVYSYRIARLFVEISDAAYGWSSGFIPGFHKL